MNGPESQREPIDELAEEFVEKQRRGERPTIDEYISRRPELEIEIRELFPALQLMERLKPAAANAETEAPFPSASGTPPKMLGDYRILREVGHGGMGTVYEAEQQSLGRRVALKVLPHHLVASEKYRKRFEREARAAARLHHTNIVPVFGIGQHDGIHYYVMQFIRGQALDEVLAELRRLGARGRDQHGEEKVDSTRPPWGEPTVEHSPEQVIHATGAQRAALSMVSGCFQEQAISVGGSSASNDASSSREPSIQASHPEAPPKPESVAGKTQDQDAALSSSSLSLVNLNRSAGSSNKSRWTYCRSVARLGVQAADALQYAHEQGVLHRDIKPSNLMLDAQGTLWVTDFGLARADDQQSLTQTGDIIGTLRYMAPEMFRGRTDARSDVCALGLTLYEMLTLRPAFDEADHAKLVRQVTKGRPPRLQTVNRHLPRDLVTIIHKAIDHEPTTRYQTAGELRDDLNHFLADEPIHARRISLPTRCSRWCKRNPAVAVLMGTVAALLLLGAIVSGVAAFRFRNLAQALGEKKTEAENAQVDSLHSLHEAYLSQARASRWSGRSGQRQDSLDALAKAADLAKQLELGKESLMELRNEAIACMAMADLRIVTTCKRPKDSYFGALDFSPNLHSYARPEPDGTITVHSFPDDDEIARLPGKGKPYCLSFSPNGQLLAVHYEDGTANRITVWDLAENKTILIIPALGMWGSAFSADSQQLAANMADRSIRVYNLDTGDESAQLRPTADSGHLCFHPSGRKLGVSNCNARTVEIWDLETASVLQTFPHPSMVMGIGWRADGKLLAVGCGDYRIYVWDVDSGIQRHILEGHKEVVHHVSFHPTQNLLVSHSWDNTTRVWSLADGSQLLAADGYFVRFDTKGRQLAFRNGLDLGLWEVPDRPECETLYGANGLSEDIRDVAISPDGQLMASGAIHSCGTRLWDLSTFEHVVTLPTGSTRSVEFHPADGSLITSSNRGLLKWPIERHANGTSRQLAIGPPISLCDRSEMSLHSMDMSTNGDFFACEATDSDCAVVVNVTDNSRMILSDGSDRTFIAVSPCGRWVARGNYGLSGADVWDTQTGKIRRKLPIEGSATVAFSPNGHWLVVAEKVYQFWDTASWELRRSISGIGGGNQGGRMAFSSDGRIMAITLACNLVQLIETDTGRALADLQVTPKPSWVQWLSFSADDSKLALACGREGIRLWDLRRVRQRLATMDLDWDTPSYPHATLAADCRPVNAKVELGSLVGVPHLDRCQDYLLSRDLQKALKEVNKALDLNHEDTQSLELRAEVHVALGQIESAIKDYGQALRRNPARHATWHERGHLHEHLKQWDDAISDLSQAIELDPDNAEYRRCRGVVHARQAQWNEAERDFIAAIELEPSPRCRDWYELALAQVAGENANNYRDTCAELLQHFGESVDLHLVAWSCVLEATAVADWPAVMNVAERAMKRKAEDLSLARIAFGAACYRAGRIDEAVVRLTEAEQQLQDTVSASSSYPAYIGFFLAMAHHGLNHQDEARQWYDKALQRMEQCLEADSQNDEPIPWNKQATLELLEQEARTLLDS